LSGVRGGKCHQKMFRNFWPIILHASSWL
jgi:hypothetical protein